MRAYLEEPGTEERRGGESGRPIVPSRKTAESSACSARSSLSFRGGPRSYNENCSLAVKFSASEFRARTYLYPFFSLFLSLFLSVPLFLSLRFPLCHSLFLSLCLFPSSLFMRMLHHRIVRVHTLSLPGLLRTLSVYTADIFFPMQNPPRTLSLSFSLMLLLFRSSPLPFLAPDIRTARIKRWHISDLLLPAALAAEYSGFLYIAPSFILFRFYGITATVLHAFQRSYPPVLVCTTLRDLAVPSSRESSRCSSVEWWHF